MKTKMMSLAFACLACASMAEARWYVGLDIGYTGAGQDTKERDLSPGSYFWCHQQMH